MGYDSSPLIHKEIFQIIYHSGGAFTYNDIYTMPVNKRRIYYNLLLEQIKSENEVIEKAKNNSKKT
jgi:hypothetical protein